MYSLECFLVAFWHFHAISIILTHLHRMKHYRRMVCDYTLVASLKGTVPKLFWNEIHSLELPPHMIEDDDIDDNDEPEVQKF